MRPLPSLEQFVEKDGHTLHALGRAAPCQISILRVGSSGPNGELSSIVYGEDMVVFARKFISFRWPGSSRQGPRILRARTTHPAGAGLASSQCALEHWPSLFYERGSELLHEERLQIKLAFLGAGAENKAGAQHASACRT